MRSPFFLFVQRVAPRLVGCAVLLSASACLQRVPITTEAMSGSDVHVAAAGGMPLLNAPSAAPVSEVGCRVTEVEGRVVRQAGDSAWLRPVTWWRAQPGARSACDRVGNSALLIMPDSGARTVQAIRTDRRKTGWLVGSIVGTIVAVVGGLLLLVIIAFNDLT
jgi:hypothetical protein